MFSLTAVDFTADTDGGARLAEWAESHNLDIRHSRFVVKAARGTCGSGALPVRGLEEVAGAASALLALVSHPCVIAMRLTAAAAAVVPE